LVKKKYCRTKGIDSSKISHTFYLIGMLEMPMKKKQQTISLLEDRLKADNNALLFLGDNIYPKGLPTTKANERLIESKLTNQLKLSKILRPHI
jgi:hypothetical protein